MIMTVNTANYKVENFPKNEKIIQKYLDNYKSSNQSVKTRRSALNTFFIKFGYKKHIFELKKKNFLDFFQYLKNNKDLAYNTKKLKWAILKSFIDYTVDYYEEDYEIIIRFPKRNLDWV